MAFEDFWFSELEEPIGASLRFSGAQQLSRTLAVPTNANTYTITCWIKVSGQTGYQQYYSAQVGVAQGFLSAGQPVGVGGGNGNQWEYYWQNGPAVDNLLPNTLRDPGAWYHLHTTFTANTFTLYINGSLAGTIPWAPASLLNEAGWNAVLGYLFNGYLSDYFMVDGQALPPTEFGKFNANGVWVPLEFTTAKANVITAGGFGTNGFALNFDAANFNSGTLVWADQ